MTGDEVSQKEHKLVGLVSDTIVHPLYNSLGKMRFKATVKLHGYNVAVVHLNRTHEYDTVEISRSFGDFMTAVSTLMFMKSYSKIGLQAVL